MNKTILFVLAALCCAVSSVRADDAADARKAFDTFVQYSKTDDERLLDLFAPDVSVTLTFDTGKETRDTVLPADKFRELVKEGLAKKEGNQDKYDDVKCVQDGDTVKLTCSRLDPDSGKLAPFLLIYGKDAAGHLLIKAMKMTFPVPSLPPGA